MTRAAPHLPTTSWGMVNPSSGMRIKVLRARMRALAMASGALRALPTPMPTCPLPSPTATTTRVLEMRPPATVLRVRSTRTMRSWNSSCGSSSFPGSAATVPTISTATTSLGATGTSGASASLGSTWTTSTGSTGTTTILCQERQPPTKTLKPASRRGGRNDSRGRRGSQGPLSLDWRAGQGILDDARERGKRPGPLAGRKDRPERFMPRKKLEGLTVRRLRVLNAAVREYVRAAAPVGSETLRAKYGIEASSATIRNDMATLERMGLSNSRTRPRAGGPRRTATGSSSSTWASPAWRRPTGRGCGHA